jgi:hypothetical protein
VGSETTDWARLTLAVRTIVGRLDGLEEKSSFIKYFQSDSQITKRHMNQWLYAHSLAARAEVVLNLVDMRNNGPSVPFSQQFFRTRYLRSTDLRDKVFGLLGVSSFTKDTIEPDYTKTIEMVAAEATSMIMRNDLATYASHRLWQYAKYARNPRAQWVLDLNGISQPLKSGFIAAPQHSDIETALRRAPGITPIFTFPIDYCSLSTVGVSLGKVIVRQSICTTTDAIPEIVKHLQVFHNEVRERGFCMSPRKLLTALLPPSHYQASEFEDLLSLLEDILSAQPLFNPASEEMCNSDEWKGFRDAMWVYPHFTKLFLTDKGHIGVCEHDAGFTVAEGNELVGLFGINLTFILETVASGRHKLKQMVHVADHVLGDENIEALGSDGDWRELVKEGKLEEFTIC